MTKPLISFIIPVYKVENYLRGCIDSIRKQSFENWEMILIDDGSPDDSGVICDGYSSLDSRIKVIHQQNQGVAVARNQGLDAAQGDWIWFVDSDDYIVEDALNKLVDTIHQHECDTIFFGMLDDYDGEISDKNGRITDIFDMPKEEFLQRVFCYANPTMLFSRSIFQSQHIRFTKGIKIAEDLELQYKYLLFCKRPVQIAANLYVYQHREGSAMMNPLTEENNMADCLKVAKDLAEFFQKFNQMETAWFTLRVRTLIKSGIQSAGRVSLKQASTIHGKLKNVIKVYETIGYTNVPDRTIQLAAFNIYLYIVLLRFFYIIKGIKR